MKVNFGLLLSVVLAISFSISHGAIPVGTSTDDSVYIHVNLLNKMNDDQDVNVKAFVYDTQEQSAANTIDINDDSIGSTLLRLDNPDLEPDYYPIRVVARDEDGRNIVDHVWTWIE